MKTIIGGFDLVTIGVPLLDSVTRDGYEVLRVHWREDNLAHSIWLLNGLVALPSLDIPQTDYFITRS